MREYIHNVESIIDNRWNDADNQEREALVEIMTLFESEEWSKLVFAAERNEISGTDIILKHREALMNNSNNAIANANIEHDDNINIYKRQISTLASYITDYLLHGK